MKPYTQEQIELCRQLYELGEKREPQTGEMWQSRFMGNIAPIPFHPTDYAQSVEWLHPLYSCDELLEMIRNEKGSVNVFCADTGIWVASFLRRGKGEGQENRKCDDNLLTALLKLAVEVCK